MISQIAPIIWSFPYLCETQSEISKISHIRDIVIFISQTKSLGRHLEDIGDKGPLSIYSITIDALGSALEDPPEIRWKVKLWGSNLEIGEL